MIHFSDDNSAMTKFSILDLSPVTQGSSPSIALQNSLKLAQLAEQLNYKRYWVAEHHSMRGIASAATSVLIGFIAGGTSKIRVGAGGIMLPNHSPLVIAEQFGTLASLYPNRIDLGLGRAPGTDALTSQALRRNLSSGAEKFPDDVLELQHYFKQAQPNQKVVAVPGEGCEVPLWILGSSLFGAQLAAAFGLPFAFASHFAPAQMMEAIDIYREGFQASEQCQSPYVMLGFNVCAAPTDEEAHFLRSSSLQSFINLRRGSPIQLPPPIEGFESSMNAQEQAMLAQINTCSAVGSLETVESSMHAFIKRTGADELMLVTSIFEHELRLRSVEITAEAAAKI